MPEPSNVVTAAASSVANATDPADWMTEWLGYLALGMFSMVLLVPTLGIVGLMVWEYFSDEAERKAERQKEIDEVMRERFGGQRSARDDEEELESTVRRRRLAKEHSETDKESDAEEFDLNI